MTLLHTMIAARAAASRAVGASPWPAETVFTPDDVLIGGMSLTGLAQAVGTPVVLAGVGGPAARGAIDVHRVERPTSLVVVRVDAVVPPLRHPREVWVDAEVEGCSTVPSAVRLIGRAGTGQGRRFRLRPDRSGALDALVRLPADLRRHDLLVIPCLSLVALEDIER